VSFQLPKKPLKATLFNKERSVLPIKISFKKKLFQDQDLIVVRKIDPNGKDWITLNYGENNSTEISKIGRNQGAK
jgi:hypothetical protein